MLLHCIQLMMVVLLSSDCSYLTCTHFHHYTASFPSASFLPILSPFLLLHLSRELAITSNLTIIVEADVESVDFFVRVLTCQGPSVIDIVKYSVRDFSLNENLSHDFDLEMSRFKIDFE